MRRVSVCHSILHFIGGIILVAICTDAFAFLGPHNPASRHLPDHCEYGDEPDIFYPHRQYIVLQDFGGIDLNQVIPQACELFGYNESNSYQEVVFDPCNPVLDDPFGTGEGTMSFAADGVVSIYRRSDNLLLGAYPGRRSLVVCGCSDATGFGNGNVNIATDGNCYCAAGKNWNPSTRMCEVEVIDYHVRAEPSPEAQPGATCNKVGDPINPVNGAVTRADSDCSSPGAGGRAPFTRFYDSASSASSQMSGGWSHSFSRRVVENRRATILAARQVGNPDHSAAFSTPEAACTSGFVQIQHRVLSWGGATPVYENNLCKLVKDGRVIAWLPVYQSSGVPLTSPAPITYDVKRDDGQVLRFWNQNGALRTSAGVTLRLSQTSSGFEIRDGNDTVERYSASGVLLSITTRAGVMQTMSYDTSGRLDTVTDSFGHRLTFEYDAQNRMISVVRQ